MSRAMRSAPCVVSVADHTGWAHLVCVAARGRTPAVIERRRVTLIEAGLPTQPYEHDTMAMLWWWRRWRERGGGGCVCVCVWGSSRLSSARARARSGRWRLAAELWRARLGLRARARGARLAARGGGGSARL